MRILLSNDDGVYAPGLQILAKALREIADVTVIAPDRNRSGASNSLSLENPIRLKHLDNGFISVEGTPTDCVHLGLTGLLDEQPDMVVSGINAGANLGDDVLYSGTVAAATEGRFLGRAAVAVSLVSHDFRYYETAATVTCQLVKKLYRGALAANTVLNVNVPDVPLAELTGLEVTRLGTRHCAEPTIKEKDPRGQTIYWVGPPGAEQDAGPGTDFYAINAGRVSISPMHLDLTHYQSFEMLADIIKSMSGV